MGRSYERAAADIAAQQIIDEMLNRYGYSVRKAAELSDGLITYSRIHDLRNGLKSPLKLSESIAFARIFNIDVEDFASAIYERTNELESASLLSQSGVELVASRDDRKFEEMEDYYE
ncbi:hypothetical protein EJ419_07210 [Alloscardovia theropitheci]|uniref:XRE family transcriptional regulator n=1 Tax=Alloscardovia theropitheci TaxID=2496842 RepID=A0A4R0QUP0_9BIFI|nr:hypothetical protein [Alloscardovia theropitheci]TCD53747.1 hypothetical protein EJ419_07210 [Alloscardovia theropitheci]